MIAKMDFAEIVFLRSEMRDIVPFLQEQGVLHLEEVPLALEEHPGFLHRVHLEEAEAAEREELEEIAALLKEIVPLLPSLPIPPRVAAAGPVYEGENRKAWMEHARNWSKELKALARKRAELQDELEVLKHYQGMVEALTPLLLSRGVHLGETARALVLEGYSQDAIEALTQKLAAAAGPKCELVRHQAGKKVMAVVCHPADKGEAVGKVLEAEGIAAMGAPDADVKGASVGEVTLKIARKVVGLEREIETIGADISAFAETHGPGVIALQQLIENRIKQLSVVDYFAQSQMIGVVHGWVPRDDFDGLRSALKARYGDRVEVDKRALHDHDHHSIPTKLKNPKLFQPFEMILSLFTPATYGSLDPTKIVAVSFILFYGFILGDAGYGLFIMAVAWWARNKWGYNEFVKNAMTIALWMGGSSIVFGVWFWEFFGNFSEYLIPFPGFPFFHRAHETELYLNMAFAVGAFYIPLALLLGFYEGWRHGHKKHAIEKIGLLLGLIAVALLASGQMPIALLVLAAATGLFIVSMGWMAPMGLIEIIGTTANVLSYARLMALGMASIALADIANEVAAGSAWYIGIPAAALIHLANIGIGVFSPTIHSLRLNYVEFLPKFYETEGRNYQPFRKEMAW